MSPQHRDFAVLTFCCAARQAKMKTQPKRASSLCPETEQMIKGNNKDLLVTENLTFTVRVE